MKNKTFVYGNISFEYFLLEDQRKTISATVYPSCNVVVKTPCIDNDQKINDFLKRKAVWILKQRKYFSQFSNQKTKDYVSGEGFYYLGRQYKLIVNKIDQNESVSFSHGRITVNSCEPKDQKRTKDLLNKWYSKKTLEVFHERLNSCFKLFDYKEKPNLKIRKLNKRWGSYFKNNTIILNEELIKASKKQIDYVIIHELCHVKYGQHDKRFYSLLFSKMSDWKDVKAVLELKLMSV